MSVAQTTFQNFENEVVENKLVLELHVAENLPNIKNDQQEQKK